MRVLDGPGRGGARLYPAATHCAAALGLCALLCLLSAVAPPSRLALVEVWYAASGALALLAGALLLARRHPRAPLVALVLAMLVGAVLVASCQTAVGVVTTSLGLVVAGQAAALLGDGSTVRAVLVVDVLALGAGMLASPVRFRPTTFVVLAATTVAMSALVGYLVARLRVLATTDDLTGALTRAAFAERAAAVVRGAARRGRPVSVVCLDVDDFKQVNDTRGHQAGDAVLVRLVEGWRAALGRTDVIGRLGGDEFAVVLDGRDEAAALAWARAAGAGGPEGSQADEPVDPTWSHGVAQARGDEPVAALLARADTAMYASKTRRTPVVPAPGPA
ncbi:GGDEF domain-containing protein [Cellulomonas triticagri]|uniref:Sensor domain-containing diguanylate cyclase n=1 Tax=Cellulomonas triticagri TaxID=2483352 RepID=A0A3M2JJ38_9CELL|nr:sensor domain-containing diguanylate cyclase [Cellulomonas triticagri]RMI13689.1 sensor domain-containing diguanylate cyclase [Cellulomonas triticagri]